MFDEIYMWLDSRSGVSFDLFDDIESLNGETAFIETYVWKSKFDIILADLSDCLDIIDDYRDEIPDTFPSADEIKRIITQMTLEALMDNINDVKQQMGLSKSPMTSFRMLVLNSSILVDLINMVKENTLDMIMNYNLYEKYEEENNNGFSEILNVYRNDLINIFDAVNTIVVDYYDNDDEEE